MTAFRLWIDAHVHVYASHSFNSVLKQSIKILSFVSKPGSNDALVLCLTEAYGEGSHHRFRQMVESCSAIEGWSFSRIDKCLYQAAYEDIVVYFVLSKQLLSTEGVELAVLGLSGEDQPRQSIQALIEKHKKKPMVLPWGFGKWLGFRGAVISGVLGDGALNKYVWLGDSGLRPAVWRQSSFFRLAQDNNVPVLSGSDPLPIKGEEARIGQIGGLLCFSHDQEQALTSTEQLFDLLRWSRDASNTSVQKLSAFGRVLGLFDALLLQIRLRIEKR